MGTTLNSYAAYTLKQALTILVIFVITSTANAGVNTIKPEDPATLEALIALHKQLKSYEEETVEKVAESYAEQTFIEKAAQKFNDVRSTLDSKLNNVYSYVMLATSVSSTALELYKTIDDYSDYTAFITKYIAKKPFTAFYFAESNVAISKEIKRCKRNIEIFIASGVNIWRASMDDKLSMLFSIKSSIETIRGLIGRGRMFCELMVFGDWQPNYFWEILSSESTKAIADAVINEYVKHTK